MARDRNGRQHALSLLAQSQRLASEAQQPQWQHLSLLKSCVVSARSGRSEVQHPPGCESNRALQSINAIHALGIPRLSVQGDLLWAEILLAAGRSAEALAQLEQLTKNVHFYRHALPGVLGSWYWLRRDSLFELLMRQLGKDSTDGSRSLLALSRLRHIEYAGEQAGGSDGARLKAETTAQIRALLAQNEATSGPALSSVSNKVKQGLFGLRQAFDRSFSFLSQPGLQNYLEQLASDTAVLTFYLEGDATIAWLAGRSGVQQVTLSHQVDVEHAVQQARSWSLSGGGPDFNGLMETLGQSLLKPLMENLPATIYWVSPPQLMGVPLDAYRVNGRYLAENHQVINLLSFPAGSAPETLMKLANPATVFLAGLPLDFSPRYASQLETSAEIRSLADQFVGPGLHILQGSALLLDEFRQAHFQSAGLVHLSMPGANDLSEPSRSRLELSEQRRGEGRTLLGPPDIRSLEVNAGLVFLSSVNSAGDPVQQAIYRPGLVTAFLDAGAKSVIASLWADSETHSEALIADFYRELLDAENISSALASTKRKQILDDPAHLSHDWARFQLFIK